MDRIERTYEANHDMQFIIKLYNYGKTSADLTDIICSIKENDTDLDDSLFLKKESLGEITYSGTDKLIVNVQWPYDEYTGFVLEKEYTLGLFCHFTGDPKADENVSKKFLLIVKQDFLRG